MIRRSGSQESSDRFLGGKTSKGKGTTESSGDIPS